MSENSVVIVTGASRGLGIAAAKWLAKTGASLMLTARSGKALSKAGREVENLGGKVIALPGDVAEQDTCRQIVEKTLESYGRIDALINNAGILEPVAPVSRTDADAWGYNIQVNLMGPYYMIRYALSALKKREGRVVNVSSGAARSAVGAWSAYCTAKAGLTHLTAVLAAEEPGITSIAVRPGVVDTDMQGVIRSEGPENMSAERAAYFQALKDDGQLEPAHVPGRTIAWLALHGPKRFSGEFLDYDDPSVAGPAFDFFGEKI